MHKIRNIKIEALSEKEKNFLQNPKISTDKNVSKISENAIREDVNSSIKNIQDKLNLMPKNERLEFCEKEFLKISTIVMAGKLSIGTKPEMFDDYEAVYNFLKWEIATLKNSEIKQNAALPDWEFMINPSKRSWFYFVKKELKKTYAAKLNSKVAKAAFAYVAIEEGYIVENDFYINKPRRLVTDFCKSFFRKNVSTSILSGKKKQADLLVHKKLVRSIFKDLPPIDWII